MDLFKDNTRIEKQDGSVVGPYKASFSGGIIFLLDEWASVEEGDVILRKLPSGKDERCIVTEATFYNQDIAGMGAHYQIKYRKGGRSEMQKPSQTINIQGAQSVQVGDYNTQHMVNSFEALVKKTRQWTRRSLSRLLSSLFVKCSGVVAPSPMIRRKIDVNRRLDRKQG